MKKLLVIIFTVFLGLGIAIIKTPKTNAYTVGTTAPNGTLAILVESNVPKSYCLLYDWQSDTFYVVALELVTYTGNLYKTLIYNDSGPLWELADAGDQEPIESYIQSAIVPYYIDQAEIEASATAYADGYNDGYDSGYNTGLVEGTTGGYNDGYSAGYGEGYGLGYTNALDDGFDDGYIEGYAEGYSIGSLNSEEASYNAGYADGLAYEGNEFYDNIESWFVPAIIVVLFLGGFIAFAHKKREGAE